MEKYRKKLSKEEFNNAIMPNGFVALELLRAEKDAKTNNGILVGFLDDVTFGTMEGQDNSTHPADVASVVGIVRKLPQKLYFNPDDNTSMPWETDMELELDDLCWFNVIESANAVEILVDKSLFRIIPYIDCYTAKRERWLSKFDNKKTTDIICLNGYCLLEQVSPPKLSALDVISEQRIYTDRGIVRYSGVPNKRYLNPQYSDDIDVKNGDLVFIKPGYTPFLLERVPHLAVFDNGKLFWVVQRRRMVFVI